MPVQLTSSTSSLDHGDEARIEIVPLIDIMFFLLASFMMVSLTMTQLHRVPIDVPEASTGSAETQTPTCHITIDAQGIITWHGEVVTLSEITTRLRNQPPADGSPAMLSADGDTRHEIVVEVLNAMRTAGVPNISIETKAPATP